MKNITGAQGAFIARLLIEAYQSKGHRILEAGFTGQKKDKLGHTRYYQNGRQVKNPNAKEKSAIHAAASTSLPAGQAPSHNDAATRVDALHADTPPEHVAALANDLMKMSVEDLTKMAKAPAKSTPPSPQQQMLNSVGSSGKADGKRTLEKTGKLPHELTLNEFAAVVDPHNAKWQNKEDPSEQHLAWVKAAMVHEPEKVPASVLQMYADKDASISNELQSRSADKPAPKAAPAPAPAAGMSADANALDALRLKSNKKQHNPAHINPEALSSLKAQGFIDDKNKLTPAGRTHLYAEKLKGAPAPTGTAAATPAAPKPKWKRANRNKDSLISIVKRKGGINSKSLKTDYDYQADIIEGGLLHAIRKQGMGLDEMAASLQVEGHIVVPEGVDPGDYLLDRMKGRHHSALKDYDKELASDEEAYYKAKQEAQQGGHDEQAIESSRTSGTEIGVNEGGQRGSSTVDEWDNSGAGETGSGEKSGTVSGDGYDSADTDDYDRNASSGEVDNSFDFGANADEPKADEAPAATAAAPPPDDAVARHMQRQAFTGVDSQGRQWQNGELVAAKDDEPAPAGKAEPEPEPKAAPEPEKKSNKFENPGDVITPSSQSRTGENPLEVVSIKDGWALVGYANRPDGPRVRMPSESLDLFRQDQQGRVDLPDHTGSEAIDKISNGKGKLLGSGDDGFAYDAGDKVVKVSTTAHFHAFGHEHRSPAEAVHRLKGQAEINNDMIKAGVPGLLPQTFEEHGNRGFITMEKLDTTTKLTPEQVDEVARNLEAMHKLGYVLGDQIQVGIDFAGHPKIFDTGKAVKAGSGGYSKEDHIDYDNSNLERFFKDNGLTYEDPEQKKLTKLRDSTRAQIEKIKAAPKDIDQGKAQFLLHSFSLHLNLLAHQTGGVLYAYAMADDPDVKKLELIARHTIDTDSFHDKTVKKLKPMDAPAAAAPDQPGFTGTDAQGREWQDGKLVAAKDEPTKAPAANTDLFGNPSKATAPKGPETMPGLFGDAVPIAPDAPTAAAGEPLPGSDNPLDRAGAGRGRQDATQDMFGLFGPGTKAKIDQVNNGPDPDPVTEPSTPAAAAAEPQPNDTPRTVAARVSAAMADEFEGARNSTLPNMGQDTPGSARHKAMAWKGLKDAEANGTAEALVKRDELLKNDPSNLSSILAPENFLGVLTSHLTMQAFPKEVLTYAEYVKNEKHHVSTPAQLREQYYEAFTEIKKLTEDLSTKKLDPRVIASEVNKKINGLIEKFRKEGQGEPSARPGRRHDGDSYNPVANSLISMQKRVLGGGANSVVGRVNDFGKRLFTATGEMSYNSKEKAVSAVADILEGKSFNQAFDTVNQKKKEFDFNEAYGGEVTRTGGKKIDMSEQSTSSPGAKVFMDDMKVRGVQFGNSLPDQERVYHAQKSAEALSDLTSILGLPDEAAGLGGKLGLAIGARGKGGALAHFEPYQANDRHNPDVGGPVINLTRANGAGSLAHEWGHGLDHYAANNKAGGGKFLSHPEASRGGAGGSPETIEAMKKVQEAMGNSGFDNRLIDETVRRRFSGSRRQYWTSPEEKFARTFERHVQNKLHAAGRENTYLTGLHKQGHPLWPTNDEMAHMAPHMDALIAAIAAEKFPGHTMPAPAPAAPKTAATKAPATEKATAAPEAPAEEKPATAMAAWWQRGGNKNESPFASFSAIHGRSPTSEESQGQLDALDYIKGKFYPKAGQAGAPPAGYETAEEQLKRVSAQWQRMQDLKDAKTTEAVMPATDPHAEKIKLIQAIIARRGLKPPQPKAQAKKIPEASEDADPRVKRIRELMDAYC